ncbi:MAG TPA: ribonuclease, partial [Terriglobales bacterium]
MTKELFVSSTPHETKVGMVEDDQLAEIYLERENEYTLAGSIYKGRVTRVLPGMQSAFVDIGLERDAFLYVSDFMDLEEHDEDLTDVVPANRPVPTETRQPQVRAESANAMQNASGAAPYVIESEPFGEGEEAVAEPAPLPSASESEDGDAPRERGWRGRRRRRGRRGDRNERSERGDRTERSPSSEPRESRYGRQSSEGTSPRDDFGPPPGYEPIILPGESISKYQRRPQGFAPAVSRGEVPRPAKETEHPEPISATFPEDEPLFAANQ